MPVLADTPPNRARHAVSQAGLYSPDHTRYLPPSHYAMLPGVQEVTLATPDGLELSAWYAPAPPGRPTVVIFPGKSGSLRSQGYRLQRFKGARMGALLLAYRGYSGNAGRPTERGLYTDARSALDWLQSRGVASESIVLYGASLGSGVATRMATEDVYAAVVLEAPYTSLVDVAALRFPIIPVRWLMRDRFDSLARIKAVTEPLLIMHGDSDTVVPQRLGRLLYAAANAPKEGFWPHGVLHKDIFGRGGFDAARDFIERRIKSSGQDSPAVTDSGLLPSTPGVYLSAQ
jgi:fermentation-respiration switch protein FrsA (DUF1100 family)